MRKTLLIITLLSLMFLTSCVCNTEVCINGEIQKEKLRIEQQEKDRIFELERLRIESEIQNNKPVEVRVQELKNQDFGASEAIITTAVVGGLWYGLGKVMSQ